jgi:hypothetical protein
MLMCRGRVQVAPKRFGDDAFLLSVHHGSDKPSNMEPNFDEVRVLG